MATINGKSSTERHLEESRKFHEATINYREANDVVEKRRFWVSLILIVLTLIVAAIGTAWTIWG